jgi:hypothetical protein
MIPSVEAEPPTSEPTTAADFGARWLAAQVTAGGYIEDPGGDPAPGPTLTAAVSLALAGVEGETFDRIVDWMAGDVDTVISSGGVDSPGSIGYLLMVVAADGGDPNNFGGVDLVDRLQQTLGDFEAGLYGSSDPTFDGVFRQSLAILGLRSHGLAINAAAVTWLEDQQCGAGSPAAALGGWQAYRADVAVPCGPPDPGFFSGPETNSTALALQAFASLGMAPPVDAIAFLEAAQGADGGWPFITGLDVDPNSTALVIQALIAAGEDPSDWATAGGDPWSSLLSWQIGCEADAADIGAFASPFSDGFPDQFATLQGVWGASGATFPLDAVTFEVGAEPCVEAPPTTEPTSPTTSTSTGGGGATTTSTGSTSRVSAQAATTASPRFAG